MNWDFEAKKVLSHWDFSDFSNLIEQYGSELFYFAVKTSIRHIAPNELDSYTRDKLISRLKFYYADVPALQGLRLEHALGL